MAGKTISLYLSEDALIKLDQIVIGQRKNGANSNRSAAVEVLIEAAYAQLKRIEPIKSGNRTMGWRAMYGDHWVGDFDLMDKPAAVLALDAYVYEELSK